MKDLLVVILCYAGDVDQVQYQLGSYTHHDASVLLLSPEDAPAVIDHPQMTNHSAGLSGWKGPHVAFKLMDHWRIMLEHPQNWFLVHEPDSVCLSSELPSEILGREDVLWSMALGEPNQPFTNYNAPWFGHRNVFEMMLREAEEHVEEWNDAWGAAESSDGQPGEGMGNSEMISTVLHSLSTHSKFDEEWLRGHPPLTLPIEERVVSGGRLPRSVWAYQENDPQMLLRATREGAWFVTGIKTTELYDQLLLAHEGAP